MNHMFKDCISLSYIPFLSISGVTELNNLFENCYSLSFISHNNNAQRFYFYNFRDFWDCINFLSY